MRKDRYWRWLENKKRQAWERGSFDNFILARHWVCKVHTIKRRKKGKMPPTGLTKTRRSEKKG